MVKIELTYDSNFQTTITHLPSRRVIETDAPVDLKGKGRTFSPTDLLAASLGSCIATVIAMYVESCGWKLHGMEVEVEKTMTSRGKRRLAKLECEINIRGSFSSKQRSQIELIAKTCPVHASLHPDVAVPMEFHWTE